MTQQNDFSGVWYSYHWYPTSDDSQEESSEYVVEGHQRGDQVVLSSETKPDGSYMLIKLTVDGRVATGTWYESTATQGEYKGMVYSGAGQLVVGKDGQSMDGMWAGVGFDHKTDKPRVYTDRWMLTRARRSTTS